MELDEMKRAWQALDRRLERNEALQATLQREISLDRTRSALRRWAWLPGSELVVSLLAAWLAGGFLGDGWPQVVAAPMGALPAGIVLVLAVIGSAAAIRQLVAVFTVDYAAPVLQIQRRLAQARALRLRLTQLGLLLWLPLWPMFVVFVAQRGLGFGIYRQFAASWLLANVGFGLALALGLVWLTRRHAAALSRWRALRWLSDSIAGRRLIAAANRIEELARFARD